MDNTPDLTNICPGETTVSPRIDSLTGIKAVSILLIFYFHTSAPNVDLGARMCELLFVISGFLVGYNHYSDEISVTWKESFSWVLRKFISFWPLHFITMLAVWLVRVRPILTKANILIALINLSLTQSLFPSVNVCYSYNIDSWFLSALMLCYFFTPVFLSWLRLSGRKYSLPLFLLVLAVRFSVEYFTISLPGAIFSQNLHTSGWIRCLEFFLGMLLVPSFFYLNAKIENMRSAHAVFSIAEVFILAAAVFLVITKDKTWFRVYYVLFFCLFVLTFAFGKGILSKFLSSKPFILFSSIQFEFYILHTCVTMCLTEPLVQIVCNSLIENLLLFALTLGFSIMYKKILSKKLSNLLRDLFKNIFCIINVQIEL